MQRIIVVAALILFFNCDLLSQTIDSLEQLLTSSIGLTAEDKTKINLQLAKLHRRTNPPEQLKYAQNAFAAAQEASDVKSQGISLSEIASHYQKADQYDSAHYYYEKAIDYFKGDRNIGNTYARLSAVEQARGNFMKSISLLMKADSLFERAGENKGRIVINTNLGIRLSLQGEYEEAIHYYQRAEAHLGPDDARMKSQIYGNFATTYSHLGNFSKSRNYAEKSIQIKKELNDITGLGNDYATLSALSTKQEDYNKSIEYLEKALAAFKKMNNKSGQAGCYNALGECYRLKGDYGKAEDYLNLAKIAGAETQNHQTLITNNKQFYELYRELKIWDKAFAYLKDYTNLNDSITEIEKIKISKELVTKYEVDQILKDKALAESRSALAEQKAEYNKVYAISIAAIGGLLLAIGFFLFYRFKAKKKEEVLSLQLLESEKHLKLEQQTRISELKALRSQMNPHFMFNALNSIQDLILLKDIRSSNKYLGKFADLLRRVLHSSSTGSITVAEEIKTLQLYAELEQLRFGDQLQISFNNDLPDDLSDDFLLPVMLIQPFVENALKHGLLHEANGKELSIHFYLKESNVVCSIDDNGVGREEALRIKQKKGGDHLGFSMKATQERVDLLNTGRSQRIKIQIIDKDKSMGTTVLIYFPIDVEQKVDS